MDSRRFFISLLMLLFVGTANAGIAVTYKFEAYSSYPIPEVGITSFRGSFTYISRQYFTTTPTFFTPGVWTSVSASALSACNTPDGTCSKIMFSPNAFSKNKWDVVEFGVMNTSNGGSTGIDYYFDLGALSTSNSYVGDSYSSIVFGSSQYASLSITVSSIADPAPDTPHYYNDCGIDMGSYGEMAGGPLCDGSNHDDYGAGVPASPEPDMPPAYFPIPEPSTYIMLLAGLSFLGFMARRGKQQPAA